MKNLSKVVKKIFLKFTLLWFLLNTLALHAEDEQSWKINLKDAEIRAFITQVADITEKSFVIDPRVKGKVTVISHSSLSREEVYELFLSVLHVHNFAAVPSVDGLIKIVPNNTATKDTIRLDSKNQVKGEELVTRVIPVKNTPVNELIQVLRPMIAQHGSLAAVPSVNAIIISDHGANIERIMSIIDKIDGAESEEIEVIQLKQAWVTDIVALLENLTPVETGSASGARGKASAASATTRVRVVADERTNRLILKGEKSARSRVRELIEKLDSPAESITGSTKVIYLRYAQASKVAEILTSLVSKNTQAAPRTTKSSKSAEDLTRTPTYIQADETLNALVVKADPASLEELQDIIRQLDVRRSQVLIEAAIIEVKGDVGRALGVQWGFGDNGNNAPVGGVSFSDFGNSLNNVGASVLAASSSTLIGATHSLSDGLTLAGGKFNSDGDFSFGAFLQAVSTTSNANILSTPSIVTLDNEEAEIIVGQEVPITTGSTTTTGSSLTPFTTTERKDVGLTLRVTPHIHEGNSIRLEIDQQSSNLSTSARDVEAGANTITTKRSIKTTVLAEDKEYIVLGGLVQEDDNERITKVPLLGDIPFIGALFRSTQVDREKKNLMVFLKPTILREPGSAGDISKGKYQKIRELQLEIDKRSGAISISSNKLLPEDIKDVWGKDSQLKPEPEAEQAEAEIPETEKKDSQSLHEVASSDELVNQKLDKPAEQ